MPSSESPLASLISLETPAEAGPPLPVEKAAAMPEEGARPIDEDASRSARRYDVSRRRDLRAGAEPTPAVELTRIVTRRWWQVALVIVASVVAAWIATALQPTRYRASSVAAVTPMTGKLSASEVFRGMEVLDGRSVVATVAALAPTWVEVDGAPFTITTVVLPNTSLVRVEAEGTSSAGAAAAANQVVKSLAGQTGRLFKFYELTAVSTAVPPRRSDFPRTGRAITVAAIAGLLLGIALVWSLERRAMRPVVRPQSA